jgi:hypothetical protein
MPLTMPPRYCLVTAVCRFYNPHTYTIIHLTSSVKFILSIVKILFLFKVI